MPNSQNMITNNHYLKPIPQYICSDTQHIMYTFNRYMSMNTSLNEVTFDIIIIIYYKHFIGINQSYRYELDRLFIFRAHK